MRFISIFLIVLFCFGTAICAQKKVVISTEEKIKDSLIKDFQADNYHRFIKGAKIELENYQKAIIPTLVKMLYNTKNIGVEPGDPYTFFANANCSYSHYGWNLPYNIDWLSIRAGWLLEDITFIDFGYKSESKVEYDRNGWTKVTWKKIATKESLLKDRKIMADKVAAWWKKNEATWTRLGAIKDALNSKNNARISKAINFIYGGDTKCDGLTNKEFESSIKPLLISLHETVEGDLKRNLERLVVEGSARDELRKENQ